MANTTKKPEYTPEQRLLELVPVVIRRPEGMKEDFTTVTVNGVNYQIEYGKTVNVPRFVKEVIDNSYDADETASRNMMRFAENFQNGNNMGAM